MSKGPIDIEALPFDLKQLIWNKAERIKRVRKVFDAEFDLYKDGSLEFLLYYDWNRANWQGGGEDDVRITGTVTVSPEDIENEKAWKNAINAQSSSWDVQVGV